MKRRKNPRKRRRNQAAASMSTGAKVAIAAAGGLGLGGLVAYLFADTDTGAKVIDDAGQVIDDSGLRLPQPSFKMTLPMTLEEFNLLDEIVCEKGEPLVADAPPGTEVDEVVEALQRALALELYPDFPWPPMSGDNPTVGQLWTELGLLARRAVVTGTICPDSEDA